MFCQNPFGLPVERSGISGVSLLLGMTGALPTNEIQSSHWLGADEIGHMIISRNGIPWQLPDARLTPLGEMPGLSSE